MSIALRVVSHVCLTTRKCIRLSCAHTDRADSRQNVKQMCYMQQTRQFGQVVQPTVPSRVERIVKNLRAWWLSESRTFTALCGSEGDVFTHGDVVLANIGVAVFVVILGLAGWLEGGAV